MNAPEEEDWDDVSGEYSMCDCCGEMTCLDKALYCDQCQEIPEEEE